MKKKVTEGYGTKKIKIIEENPSSGPKIKKMKEERKCVSKEERNVILNSQKVLTGRVFDSKIFEKIGMVEFVESVRH